MVRHLWPSRIGSNIADRCITNRWRPANTADLANFPVTEIVQANALWLVSGLEHPAFSHYAAFLSTLFHRFEAFDYRKGYLDDGAYAVQRSISSAVEKLDAQFIIYSQFPSTYAYVTPQFLAELGERRIVVGLGWDDEMYFEQSKYFYQSCTAVITTDIAGAEWLRQAGIPTYLAAVQVVRQARATKNVAEDIPISFVGDMSKSGRKEYIHHLEGQGFPVQDYGAHSRNGRLSEKEAEEIFLRSMINLNFTKTNPPHWIIRSDPLRARLCQIKSRPFELAAIGKFCLCEWAPCVSRWFREGSEIAVFRDSDHLVEQVKHYLADDIVRQRIAASANQRYRTDFDPRIQLEKIFSELATRPDARNPKASWIIAPIFIESVGRSRASAFLHAVRRMSLLRAVGELLSTWMTSVHYWRGFAQSLRDVLYVRLRH